MRGHDFVYGETLDSMTYMSLYSGGFATTVNPLKMLNSIHPSITESISESLN